MQTVKHNTIGEALPFLKQDDVVVAIPMILEPGTESMAPPLQQELPTTFPHLGADVMRSVPLALVPSQNSPRKVRIARKRPGVISLRPKKASEVGTRRNIFQLLSHSSISRRPALGGGDVGEDVIVRSKAFQTLEAFEQRCDSNRKLRELVLKVQSVRKGLHHISTCDGCDRMLCRSTRRLVEKVKQHKCLPSGESPCRACHFWQTLVALHRRDCMSTSGCIVPKCHGHDGDHE